MLSQTILVTRPAGEEAPLMEALQQSGHRAIHEPLTHIFLNHTARAALAQTLSSDPAAVIVTSRQGARALAALCEWRDLALICVGEATAEAALSCGFSRVSTAGGNLPALVNYVADAYDGGSRFVYVSALHTRGDLAALLHSYGMETDTVIAYEAVAAEALSDTLIEQLKRRQVDGVTFMSARPAAIFWDLLQKAGIHDCVPSLAAYCVSPAVAEKLAMQPWKQVFSAAQPTLASLVECVDNNAA